MSYIRSDRINNNFKDKHLIKLPELVTLSVAESYIKALPLELLNLTL